MEGREGKDHIQGHRHVTTEIKSTSKIWVWLAETDQLESTYSVIFHVSITVVLVCAASTHACVSTHERKQTNTVL